MNFNKYALVMFAFASVISIMMGTSGSSSFAQENLTSSASQGADNLTSSTAGTNSTTSDSSSSPLPTTNDSSAVSSAGNNAGQNDSAQSAGGPLDMIKKMFSSLMGGNK